MNHIKLDQLSVVPSQQPKADNKLSLLLTSMSDFFELTHLNVIVSTYLLPLCFFISGALLVSVLF